MAKKPKGALAGADKVLKNLNAEIRKMEDGAQAGMTKGLLIMAGKAVENAPRITGNLRNSRYIVTPEGEEGTSGSFTGEDAGKLATGHKNDVEAAGNKVRRKPVAGGLGFSAAYALAVHENENAGAEGFDESVHVLGTGSKVKLLHSEKGGAKFLEEAVVEGAGMLLEHIRQGGKVD